MTFLPGSVIWASSTAGSIIGPQLLYQAIGAPNLRVYVQGQDDAGTRRWRTDYAGQPGLYPKLKRHVTLSITLTGMTVEVSLEAEASAADRAAVVAVFDSADILADVKADYIRRSTGLLPWLIVIGVVAARFLWAAVGGAGDEAGRDTWKGLKWLVAGLYEARRSSQSPQGGVSISDSETRVEIQFPPGLPDQAFIRIVQIETPSAPLSGILRWDEDAQDWTDVFAAQYRCFYGGCSADATQSRVRNPAPGAMESRLLCDLHAAAADADDPQVWA